MVALEESRLCRRLGPAEQRLARQYAVPTRFAAAEVIFDEGAEGDGLYIIEEGRVEIFVNSAPGREHILSRMDPGDYFGEMAIFDGGSRSASARASTAVVAWLIPSAGVIELLERSPLLAASLVRDASLRLRDFNRKFLNEALKAERVQTMERLARSIVHDFRNPLNVIGLAADLAGEPASTPDARRSARLRIRSQVEVINRMLQEMLDFTRTAPDRVVLPQIALAPYLTEVFGEFGADARRRGVDFVVTGSFPDRQVRLDSPRFTRVFTNLLNNAFDAVLDVANPRVSISFDADDDWVTVDVTDNGRGIPPGLESHLFEPFFTFGKAHGTGLGLAICERIVREHGGAVSVSRPPAGGACFTVKLPVAKPGDTDRLKTLFQG
jgi:signal transduction histidine kinase